MLFCKVEKSAYQSLGSKRTHPVVHCHRGSFRYGLNRVAHGMEARNSALYKTLTHHHRVGIAILLPIGDPIRIEHSHHFNVGTRIHETLDCPVQYCPALQFHELFG